MVKSKTKPDGDAKAASTGDRPPAGTLPPKRGDQAKEPRRLQPRAARTRSASAVGRSQRRMIRVGLLLIVGIIGIFGGFVALHRSTLTTSVYVAARAIPAGALITRSDVTTEQLSLPGVPNALPVSLVVNNRAAVGILRGEVLTVGLTTSQNLQSGQAIVGAALPAGHMPATGVVPGDSVEIIFTGQSPMDLATSGSPSTPASPSGTGSANTTSSSTAAMMPGDILGNAVVASVSPGSAGSATVVDLMLPTNEAPTVAAAAAGNNMSIVSES